MTRETAITLTYETLGLHSRGIEVRLRKTLHSRHINFKFNRSDLLTITFNKYIPYYEIVRSIQKNKLKVLGLINLNSVYPASTFPITTITIMDKIYSVIVEENPKIKRVSMNVEQAKFTFHFPISYQNKNAVIKKKIIFYARKALADFASTFVKEVVLSHSLPSPKTISIKTLKSTWGICSSKTRISLNWRLALAPINIVKYVIIHELCHLVEPNHSKEFWCLVAEIDNDYKQNRKWLKHNGHTLNI